MIELCSRQLQESIVHGACRKRQRSKRFKKRMHERVREEEKRGSAEDDNVPSYTIYSDSFCAEQSESAASDNRGWMAMPVKRLRKECRKRMLPVTGRKADLAQRLPEYAVEASKRCINATIVDTSQRCIVLHYQLGAL